MKIYFAGAVYNEVFEPKKHAREDLYVFNLSITQKEDEVARAEIKTANDEKKLQILEKFKKFFISWENEGQIELVFTGIFAGLNKRAEGHFCVFELFAASADLTEKIENYLERQKVHPYWDPLFVPPEKRGKSLEVQDTQLSSLYVDRRTWALSRSGFFEGSESLDLKGNFIRDSLVIKKVQEPLSAVNVRLKAEWVQDESGAVNIARAIERKFPGFQINSFSSIAIEANWPKSGQKLGKSGYEVIHSRFDKVWEKRTYSPPLSVSNSDQRHYVPRHWYKSRLYLRWQYRQKRKESLVFTLKHDLLQGVSLVGSVKDISVCLENINPDPHGHRWIPQAYYKAGMMITIGAYTYVAREDHKSTLSFEEDRGFWNLVSESELSGPKKERETFFLTPRGQKAYEHALTLAQYHLARSARSHEITVTGAWEDLVSVTTDHSLALEDPRIPGGRVKGKVVFYKIYAEGESGFRAVDVTIAPALGIDTGRSVAPEVYAPEYALDGYVEGGVFEESGTLRNSCGVQYYCYQNQRPQQSIDCHRLQTLGMVRRIKVKNGPAQQFRALKNSDGLFREVLKSMPTQVQVDLYDLRTRPCFDHTIQVALASGWSALAQLQILK